MQINTDMLANVVRKYPNEILLDAEDYEKYKLHMVFKFARGYVQIRHEGKMVYLHQLLTGFKFWKVDHKNGIPWDCRKDNLRGATTEDNSYNQGKQITNTSGYKGVSWCSRDKKWKAQITFNKVVKNLGRYDTPEKAHAAYIRAAKRFHGEFANFGLKE